MTHPYSPPTIESHERPDPQHSDAIERLDLAHSEITGSSEHLGNHTSENDTGAIDLEASCEVPSNEEFRSQQAADQLWNDLKAETGYSSYADYLKACSSERHPYLDKLLESFSSNRGRDYCSRKATFTIVDLSVDESSRLHVTPRCYSDSDTEIVMRLRQSPANVAVQVLLWNTGGVLDEEKVNALGLGLKIHPRFFDALCFEHGPQEHFESKYIKIGNAVATVVRHYRLDKPDTVPIVIVARAEWVGILEKAMEEIGDIVPFQIPIVETYPCHAALSDLGRHAQEYLRGKVGHRNYLHLLKWCLEREEKPTVGVKDLLMKPVIPLLYIDIFRIRNICNGIRYEYKALCDDRYNGWSEKDKTKMLSDLPWRQRGLRESLGESEASLNHLLRYMRSQTLAICLLTESWLKVEGDVRTTYQEAGRLEAQIRDYLQMQVGEWALEESKKSIELSNRQIEEGKRVKIFTILAFFYVPLNLATSIFGMNLNELNGSGQKLWVFLVTAVIALLTTGASWFVMEEVNTFLKWRNKSHSFRKQYTIGSRIGMLAWLHGHGFTNSTWKTGIWWRILIDSDSRVKQPGEASGRNACEIVSQAQKPDSIWLFLFDSEDDWIWS